MNTRMKQTGHNIMLADFMVPKGVHCTPGCKTKKWIELRV